MHPRLIEAEQLHAQLQRPELLLVDMRTPPAYAAGHIPGARQLDYSALVRSRPPAMGLLPEPAALAPVLSRLGLSPDAWVVAYDDEGNGRAARLLWTLEVLGHPHLSLLDGGLPAWLAAGLPLSREAPPAAPGSYAVNLANPAAYADKDYVLAHLGDPDVVLLDTRSPAEYAGLDVRAARGGHIPGAVNFNWTEAMDPIRQLRLKPAAELRALLRSCGATPDKEVIVYCQTHHRSAHTYWVLKHLGYRRVRGYAGAWSEWGNDPALPIE
ncbi:MAG TPA: sulfurtransferase [Candidatus Competibacteraceae bacterium]|nr:sulfurtransferase [Candidatus Competibacteraceae bacterium]